MLARRAVVADLCSSAVVVAAAPAARAAMSLGGNTSGSDPTNDCLPTNAHTNPLIGGLCSGKPCWKQIQLQARGAALAMPADLTTITHPIIVQLQNADGLCWETVFSRPAVKYNPEQLKGVAE